MSWVWGARLECGHETGGEVESRIAFVTPVELQQEFWCPQCKATTTITTTWGRGR